MISLKVLSTAAAMALLLATVLPDASFARGPNGGGAARSGARGPGPSAGGFRGPAGGGAGPRYGGGGPQYGGGGYRGGYGRAIVPGIVAGAVIGGAIASQGYYGPGYYGYGPDYDDSGYDDGVVAVAPAPGGDAVAYCLQRFRSYDPASGTYLGNDGLRHPCP